MQSIIDLTIFLFKFHYCHRPDNRSISDKILYSVDLKIQPRSTVISFCHPQSSGFCRQSLRIPGMMRPFQTNGQISSVCKAQPLSDSVLRLRYSMRQKIGPIYIMVSALPHLQEPFALTVDSRYILVEFLHEGIHSPENRVMANCHVGSEVLLVKDVRALEE